MGIMRYLLDTNSIIYILNQNLILKNSNEYHISIITEIELLSYSKLTLLEIDEIKKVLSKFNRIELTETVKDKTIMIRRKSKIKLPDSIIIASTLYYQATLITNDQQLIKTNLVTSQLIETFLL
ncbi:PIN domain nuclease [Methylococcaceae bacterium HT1]|nr:PIN domain nuclease [Methylococcaceae bacterium HT1]